jgi:ankyrin repeat protein
MNKTAPAILALALLTSCSSEKMQPGTETGETASATNTATVLPANAAQAALQGDVAIITNALARGFAVDARDGEQRTMLMYAAFNGHTALVEALLDAGADVNAQDHIGSTALMFAASGPSSETVRLLLDRGAGIDMIDGNEHFTALMWAAAEGQADNVKLLLEHNADPTLQDIDGDTARSFAAKSGHAGVVEIFTQAGVEE